MLWRRSYDVPRRRCRGRSSQQPHRSALPRRTGRIHPGDRVPEGRRRSVTPYFADVIVEDLRSEAVRGGAVIVVAHGNSLRAFVWSSRTSRGRDCRTRDPDGHSYRVTLDDGLNILSAGYLGDPRPRGGAEAVARQAG